MDSFNSQFQQWINGHKQQAPASDDKHRTRRIAIISAVTLFFILLLLAGTVRDYYTDWLWFSSLGYGNVFLTVLKSKLAIFFIAALTFGLFFIGNLVLATYLSPKKEHQFWPWQVIKRIEQFLRLNVILGTVLLSLIFGAIAQGNWLQILQFFNQQPFMVNDPVFQRDVAFYVYSLPYWQFIRSWLTGALILTLAGSVAIYLLSYVTQQIRFDRSRRVLGHLGGLLAVIIALLVWGNWLSIWELVFSRRGVVFGASYADMNAQLPAQWILIGIGVIVIGTFIYAIWKRKIRLPFYAIGSWLVAFIIIGNIFPALVQRFQVEPSELARETPYIDYNIQFTRNAFGLDRIEEEIFPAEDMPTAKDITDNSSTINNIRLWDHRPLKDTYNQIQSFRPYYDFLDVDIDRYIIDGNYRQVMLSARELSVEKLASEAQTWVNRQLQFTHGYGFALSPVTEVSPQGLPELIIKDIPPTGEIEVTQPQIYFGEKTDHYIIVNTKTMEFDFPMGDENVFGEYEGTAGVDMGGFFNRLLYAWRFGDLNILISNELEPESRMLYNRNIQKRVKELAPFLMLDEDPYLVTIDGQLLWIQDAYTYTTRYPYSEPISNGLNYIRNSVKVVIDAYNGSVTCYVTEPDDALIQTYQAIFPDLFRPDSEMPDEIRAHLRYPEKMFKIQAGVYQSYHMQDARVFYNKEDLWSIPKEIYYGEQQQSVEPYYIIMRLPDEENEEFLLMQPFTPASKNNTIGWLAARCDGDKYGTLLAYFFPKDRLVYGPSQIEDRIQQDTVITEQLALWSRGGSEVLRGNLLMIPLGDSNIYIEPVFLQAKTEGLPELKRVIVAAGDSIAMEATLSESLAAVFGTGSDTGLPAIPTPTEPGEPVTDDITALILSAQQHYEKAEEYLKAGDWTNYGEELAALKEILAQLALMVEAGTE